MTEDPGLLAERDARLAALGKRPPWWRPLARRRWDMRRAAIEAVDVSAAAAILRAAYGPEQAAALHDRLRPGLASLRGGGQR